MLSPLLIFMGGALGLIAVGLALKESARLKGRLNFRSKVASEVFDQKVSNNWAGERITIGYILSSTSLEESGYEINGSVPRN